MTVIVEPKKRYVVRVTLKSGEKLTGELIRTSEDSLSIQKNKRNYQLTYMAASQIKSIRIRKKGAIGRRLGIGACIGAIVGGIIALDSYKPTITCSSCQPLDEPFRAGSALVGMVIGGAAGLAAGALIGSGAGKEFKIEGDQAKFDLFAYEFK